ncbi:hypothetical protein BC826DRAFT_1192225 [Russula brevipes]|nr:hypothetical protein BC826DRAFT_1192225 [Russula brevipes]
MPPMSVCSHSTFSRLSPPIPPLFHLSRFPVSILTRATLPPPPRNLANAETVFTQITPTDNASPSQHVSGHPTPLTRQSFSSSPPPKCLQSFSSSPPPIIVIPSLHLPPWLFTSPVPLVPFVTVDLSQGTLEATVVLIIATSDHLHRRAPTLHTMPADRPGPSVSVLRPQPILALFWGSLESTINLIVAASDRLDFLSAPPSSALRLASTTGRQSPSTAHGGAPTFHTMPLIIQGPRCPFYGLSPY